MKEQDDEGIKMKIWEINVCSISASIIHNHTELMTLFINKLQSVVTHTEEFNTIKFSIGYL